MFPLINWIIDQFDIFIRDDDNDNKFLNPFSIALYTLFPATALIFVFAKKEYQSKLLVLLDRNFISVICPSFSKRRKILKWASGRLPLTWSSHLRTLSGGIVEFWVDGSLLCTLINTAVPGACPNPHRHWKKSPVHAQAVAYKYLGVMPQFTHKDLEDEFPVQERRFINFLYEIYQSINNRPSEKDALDQKFSVEYLARGMGLCAGERHRKVTFYIYPHKKTRTINTICITIRGPYSTFGKRTFNYPNVQNFLQSANKSKTQENNSSIFTSFALDLTSFLGKDKHRDIDDIPIEIDIENERIKVTYIPKNYGMYEIKLLSDNEIISGSPYNIHIIDNTTNKVDSFDDKPTKTTKPVHIIKECKTIIKGSNFTKQKPELPTIVIKQVEKIMDDKALTEDIVVDVNNTKNYHNQIKGSNFTKQKPDLPTIVIKQVEKIMDEKALTEDIVVDVNNTKNYHNQIENNNKLKNVTEDKCIKSSVAKFQALQNTEKDNIANSEPITNELNTSPICVEHIVPEVTKENLADKRRSLQKQNVVETVEEPANPSFSNNENDEISRPMSDLSKSLPNISESCNRSKSVFLKNKTFWESMSKSKSINRSIPKSTALSPVKKNFFASLDNISIQHKETKTYKFIDNSLDYCTIFSIKQRKQFLMKNESVKEDTKMNNKSDSIKFTKSAESKYNSQGNNCSENTDNEIIPTKKLYEENFIRNSFKNIDNFKLTKPHFSKSVKYFKQLEQTLKPKKNSDFKKCNTIIS